MEIHHHHFIHFEDDEVLSFLEKISKKVNKLMATMQDLRAAVERNTSVDDSVLTLLSGISQQLKDAQAQNDPQAIQDIINQLDANTQKMSDAVKANTKAEDEPTNGQPSEATPV